MSLDSTDSGFDNVQTNPKPSQPPPKRDEVFYNEIEYSNFLAEKTKLAAEEAAAANAQEPVQVVSPPEESAQEPEVNPPPAQSNTVESDGSSTTQGDTQVGSFNLEAPEMIAIFNQKMSDFSNHGLFQSMNFSENSPAAAALEKAYVEGKISDAFVSSVYKITKSGGAAAIIDDALKSVDDELKKADDVLQAISNILKLIRDLDTELMFKDTHGNTGAGGGGFVEKNKYMQDNSIKVDKILPEQMCFGGMWSLLNANFIDNSETFTQPEKSSTARLRSALTIVSYYLSHGHCSTQVKTHEISQFLQTPVAPGAQPSSFSPPSLVAVGERVSAVGTPFDQQDTIAEVNNAGMGVAFDNPVYSEVSSNVDGPFYQASVYLTMVANEFLFSSGLGRLEDTTLGNRFGTNSKNFREKLVGVPPTNILNQLTTNTVPGSIAATHLVGPSGDPNNGEGVDGIMILDGQNKQSTMGTSSHPNNATSAFLKSVITSPTNNLVLEYEKALKNAVDVSSLGVKYFEKLQHRDQSVSLITPRHLFVRVLEEVNTSISAFGTGFEAASKNRCGELAMFAHIGGQGINPDERFSTEKMRNLLFSSISRRAFAMLQKQNIKILAGAADAGKKKVTEVTVVASDGTSTTNTITTKDKTADVDSNKVVLDSKVLRFSGDDTANFLKSTAIPEQSFIGAHFTGDFPHEDSLIADGMASVDPLADEPASSNDSSAGENNAQSFDEDSPPPEENDMPEAPAASETAKKAYTNEGAFVLWNTPMFELFTEIEQDNNSLVSRLAQVFVDCHQEASLLATSDNKNKSFIGTQSRVTKASGIDASTLIGMIFHSACLLAKTFANATVIDPSEAAKIQQADEKEVFPDPTLISAGSEVNMFELFYNQLVGLPIDVDGIDEFWQDVFKQWTQYWTLCTVSSRGTFGFSDKNSNKKTNSSLSLLIGGAKSNDIGGLYDQLTGQLLTGADPNSKMSYYHEGAVSFTEAKDLIMSLAKSHRTPYNALLINMQMMNYTLEKAELIIGMGKQLRGEAEKSDQVVNFLNFYNNHPHGNSYVQNLSQRALDVSAGRHQAIMKTRNYPMLKSKKLSKGEMNAMKGAFSVIHHTFNTAADPTVLFVTTGIPRGYVEHLILEEFDIVDGNSSGESHFPAMQLSLQKWSGLTGEFVGSSTQNCFLEDYLKQDSFDNFADSPPTSMTDMVHRALIYNPQTHVSMLGLDWLEQWPVNELSRSRALKAMKLEIQSFLMRKFFSITTPLDLFLEDMIPGPGGKFSNHLRPRSNNSANLASTIMQSLQGKQWKEQIGSMLPKDTFKNVFRNNNDGLGTYLDEEWLKALTVTKTTTTKTGQLTNFPEIDFAVAELFFDVFSTLPFRANTIMSEIFAPLSYEKIILMLYHPDTLGHVGVFNNDFSDQSSNSTNFEDPDSPGTVSLYTYETVAQLYSGIDRP